jgi:hypothetical protein
MTEPPDELDERTLSELLASPAVWIEPDPATEEAVVDAIAGERSVDRRTGVGRRLVTAAAAVLVIASAAVIGSMVLTRDASTPGVAVALASTDPSSAVTANATVDRRPGGTRIVLDASGLPPAAAGSFYHAWLTNDVERVSAGTFHLRGTTGEIELWCGIDDPEYSTLAVTLERTGGRAGPVVLVGRIER